MKYGTASPAPIRTMRGTNRPTIRWTGASTLSISFRKITMTTGIPAMRNGVVVSATSSLEYPYQSAPLAHPPEMAKRSHQRSDLAKMNHRKAPRGCGMAGGVAGREGIGGSAATGTGGDGETWSGGGSAAIHSSAPHRNQVPSRGLICHFEPSAASTRREFARFANSLRSRLPLASCSRNCLYVFSASRNVIALSSGGIGSLLGALCVRDLPDGLDSVDHTLTRSMSAPSMFNFSSIDSYPRSMWYTRLISVVPSA